MCNDRIQQNLSSHARRVIFSDHCSLPRVGSFAVKTAKEKAYKAEWYQKNRDRIIKKSRLWAINHPEQKKKNFQLWLSQNLSRFRAVNKAWRKAHPELVAGYVKKWSSNNKSQECAQESKRRARIKNAVGTWSHYDIEKIMSVLGVNCLCCGAQQHIHIDHIIPLAKGGSNGPLNLQLLCRSCNCKKHTTIQDFRTKKQIKKLVQLFQLKLF
jgi:5-methylcytosine-specific restriction endonuclease McrA